MCLINRLLGVALCKVGAVGIQVEEVTIVVAKVIAVGGKLVAILNHLGIVTNGLLGIHLCQQCVGDIAREKSLVGGIGGRGTVLYSIKKVFLYLAVSLLLGCLLGEICAIHLLDVLGSDILGNGGHKWNVSPHAHHVEENHGAENESLCAVACLFGSRKLVNVAHKVDKLVGISHIFKEAGPVACKH